MRAPLSDSLHTMQAPRAPRLTGSLRTFCTPDAFDLETQGSLVDRDARLAHKLALKEQRTQTSFAAFARRLDGDKLGADAKKDYRKLLAAGWFFVVIPSRCSFVAHSGRRWQCARWWAIPTRRRCTTPLALCSTHSETNRAQVPPIGESIRVLQRATRSYSCRLISC